MPITVNCSCGHQFRVRDEYAGKKAQCPNCGEPVLIPHAADPSATVNESPADFPQFQPAPAGSAYAKRQGGDNQWFAGLESGLFGLGRLSGLACLLIGLIFVLMARGCDSLANRSALSSVARYQLAQSEFNNEWEDKREDLQEKIDSLQDELQKADSVEATEDIRKRLDDARTDLQEHDEDQQRARRNKERGDWKSLKRDAENAVENNTLGRFWRELLFVIGTVILSLGLLTVGFTGQTHERWICLIMITIITFSIYVGGIAWMDSVQPPRVAPVRDRL